jgi:UDP-N-acetylglucosamine acyltransferase
MNKIHPTVIIEGEVIMGENNEILPHTIIYGPVEIGNNNWIGPQVIIGTPGQDTKNPRYDSSNCKIKIGHNNIIREHTAIQKPCYDTITEIGSNCYIMHGAHIPHDAIIKDYVTVTPGVIIGGISILLTACNIGMGATLHQESVIGQYSIVATNSAVIKNVKPFSRYIPGKPISVNTYAINKFGFNSFENEINSYVLENTLPKSIEINTIINEFNNYHIKSRRKLY